MNVILKSVGAETEASIWSENGEENFARLTVERNPEIEVQILKALGKHAIAQKGYIGPRMNKITGRIFVTDLSKEELVLALQTELTVESVE